MLIYSLFRLFIPTRLIKKLKNLSFVFDLKTISYNENEFLSLKLYNFLVI